jgi:hypothetical protein
MLNIHLVENQSVIQKQNCGEMASIQPFLQSDFAPGGHPAWA